MPPAAADSARVVAELEELCEALTELRASSVEEPRPLAELERFIASVSVPPPPTGDELLLLPGSADDDLSAYIIPPPPPSCEEEEEQRQVLARFERASQDLRRLMAAQEPPPFQGLRVLGLLEPSPAERRPRRGSDSHTYENCELPRLQETHSAPQLHNGGLAEDKPRVPPRLRRGAEPPRRDRTGSCDQQRWQVARSHSWTNLHAPLLATRRGPAGKPPLPPTLQQVSYASELHSASFQPQKTFSKSSEKLIFHAKGACNGWE